MLNINISFLKMQNQSYFKISTQPCLLCSLQLPYAQRLSHHRNQMFIAFISDPSKVSLPKHKCGNVGDVTIKGLFSLHFFRQTVGFHVTLSA